MAMNIGCSLPAAKQLVEAVENAGGQIPPVLNSLLDGYALLAEQPAQSDPARGIIEAAAEGSLTAEKLTTLCAEATQAQAAAEYRGQLRQRAEGLFTERFYQALCDEGANAILDSLRGPFTSAAQTLADALSIIDINVDPRQLAEHGSPRELDAWRSVRPAVQRLDEIAGIARLFGPRSVFWTCRTSSTTEASLTKQSCAPTPISFAQEPCSAPGPPT